LLIIAIEKPSVMFERDLGEDINRKFNCADEAKKGESSLNKIYQEGEKAKNQNPPPVCRQLSVIVSLFGAGFSALSIMALKAL
jgi:hypothetical protein